MTINKKNGKDNKYVMIVVIIAIVIVAADQLSKVWVLSVLKEVKDIPVIDGVLHWHYAQNTGAAFSMMKSVEWFPVLVAVFAGIVALAALIYSFTRKHKMHILEIISLGLVIGGAIGNLIDRIRFGYVLDFIYVKLINFAIFNIADAALVVGAILLSIYVLFIHEKYILNITEKKDAKSES